MNNIRDKFEKQIAIMEANLIHDNDAYFEARPNVNTDGYKTIFNAGYKRAWLAATEQSQKEIEALQAREKVLVDLLGECVDTVRNEYNEMLELYSIYPHKQYDIQCQKELLNGIEQALVNVRGEVK